MKFHFRLNSEIDLVPSENVTEVNIIQSIEIIKPILTMVYYLPFSYSLIGNDYIDVLIEDDNKKQYQTRFQIKNYSKIELVDYKEAVKITAELCPGNESVKTELAYKNKNPRNFIGKLFDDFTTVNFTANSVVNSQKVFRFEAENNCEFIRNINPDVYFFFGLDNSINYLLWEDIFNRPVDKGYNFVSPSDNVSGVSPYSYNQAVLDKYMKNHIYVFYNFRTGEFEEQNLFVKDFAGDLYDGRLPLKNTEKNKDKIFARYLIKTVYGRGGADERKRLNKIKSQQKIILLNMFQIFIKNHILLIPGKPLNLSSKHFTSEKTRIKDEYTTKFIIYGINTNISREVISNITLAKVGIIQGKKQKRKDLLS